MFLCRTLPVGRKKKKKKKGGGEQTLNQKLQFLEFYCPSNIQNKKEEGAGIHNLNNMPLYNNTQMILHACGELDWQAGHLNDTSEDKFSSN